MLAACEKPQITVTQVPKPPAQNTMPNLAAAPSQDTPVWTAPESWIPQPTTAMRKGNWLIEGENGARAEVSALAFPGNVGGELANVNRWLGQIQAPVMTQAELDAIKKPVEISHHAGFTVFLKSDPQSIYAAVIPVHEQTWFIKMMGDTALVQSEREAFDRFLQTISFHD